MKLRPYHNPENVDESLVPDGWRFFYIGEFPSQTAIPRDKRRARVWLGDGIGFSIASQNFGWVQDYTYIVPVDV